MGKQIPRLLIVTKQGGGQQVFLPCKNIVLDTRSRTQSDRVSDAEVTYHKDFSRTILPAQVSFSYDGKFEKSTLPTNVKHSDSSLAP